MKYKALKLLSAFIAMIMIASCLPINGFALTEYEDGYYKYTVDGSNATHHAKALFSILVTVSGILTLSIPVQA